MTPQQARAAVADTFPKPFNRTRFLEFTRNLLNKFDETKAAQWNTTYVKAAFKSHVNRFERLGTYTSPDGDKLDVLVVRLADDSKLQRARTALRNFVADHLKTRDEKDAALVAFVSPGNLMNKVPIPDATVADKTRLAKLAERAAKAATAGDSAEVEKNERDIDGIVYRLFDLTADEIALIETALANTRAQSRDDDDEED